MGTASLFLFHLGSNAGYAIAPLETLFFDVGLELADHDPTQVHFGYPSLEKGPPRSLVGLSPNLLIFNFNNYQASDLAALVTYARTAKIGLVFGFDIQPVHPLFRALRVAGVQTILSYWGAPIASAAPAWKLALKRLAFRLSRSKLDGLIFESQAMADLAVYGRGVPHSLADVVPLGVDTMVFKPDKSDHVYSALGFPRNRRVVVYAGHMERRKGVHVLVEAAIELLHRRHRTDVCFLILGNIGPQSREYEHIYAGLGIDEWIRFAGYRNDLALLYPSCFCGVIPSTGWDSFPRTSLEMAACGLPVVASRLHGLPEAVVDGRTGLLFPPGDWKALADIIERLLDRPALAAECGARGRERCERDLTVPRQRERLLAVVRKRLHQNRNPPSFG